MKSIFIATLALLLFSCAAIAGDAPVCNGSAGLCDRRYNEVTFAGAHNAMSCADQGWSLPNHARCIADMLEYGIRAINIDIYFRHNRIFMCHGYCELGNRPLVDALREIRAFMESNPGEIVTINFQNGAWGHPADVDFIEAGLDEFALAKPEGEQWPTLGEMVSSGKRLVVFGAGSEQPWDLDPGSHIWESPYAFPSVDRFECGTAREQPIYLLNHFVERPMPAAVLSRRANKKSVIMHRALGCWNETGRKPNIILFDYACLGDTVAAVDALNTISASEVPAILEKLDTR